jgi:hypothetical protein
MSNAGIYDVILTVLVVFLMVALAVLWERVRRLNLEVLRLRSEVAARRAAIATARATRQVPGVDSKVIVTRRDTDDIPHTGRMSQGVKRVRTNARPDNDDRLPFDPGSPAA